MQAILKVTEWMEQSRPDRAYVRRLTDEHKIVTEANYKSLTYEDRDHIDNVCRSFDLLGYMDRTRLVDKRVVNELYAVSLCSLYDSGLAHHISRQDETKYYELRQLFERVRFVPENHPSKNDDKDWPRNPR